MCTNTHNCKYAVSVLSSLTKASDCATYVYMILYLGHIGCSDTVIVSQWSGCNERHHVWLHLSLPQINIIKHLVSNTPNYTQHQSDLNRTAYIMSAVDLVRASRCLIYYLALYICLLYPGFCECTSSEHSGCNF